MDWKTALRSALAGYAELHGAGRVLDCHYVKVDDTRTLSYNGSQYMFFIPPGTTPPNCGIQATVIATTAATSVWAVPYDYDTHLKKIAQRSAMVATSRQLELSATTLESMSPLERMKHLSHGHNVMPWQVLGVSRQASDKEVRDAYRKLSLALHPDKHGNGEDYSMAFAMVSAAYTAMTAS